MISEENEQVLKAFHPKILEFVYAKESIWSTEPVVIVATKNNQITASLCLNEKLHYFHSQYNPEKEADQFVAQFENEYDPNKHVLFYGFGLGYYIDAFFRKYETLSFSIFDPFPAFFYQSLSHLPASKLHLELASNIYLENHVDFYLENFVSKIQQEVLIVIHPVYMRVFKEEYDGFLKSFKAKLFNQRSSISVNHSFEKLWIVNSEANFNKVLATPSILREKKNFLVDKTVIMVAAGPSLQDEFENLRYIKQNKLAYIFAIGSANKALIIKGIYPDAVCSYDPGSENAEVYLDMIHLGITEIPLIFGSSVFFRTLETYPGPMLHMVTSQDRISAFYLGDEELKSDKGTEIVSDASSIALLTLEIIMKLGCTQVILVGQNFAYRNKQYYAEGISYSFRDMHLTERDNNFAEEVDCVDGGKVATFAGHSMGRRSMEMYLQHRPEMRVINTTRGGAKIAGTEYKYLEDVMEDSLKEPIVQEDWYKTSVTQYDIEFISKQHKKLVQAYKEFKETVDTVVKSIRRLETAASLHDYKVVYKIFAKFELLNLKLYQNCYYDVIIQPMVRVPYALLQQILPIITREQSPVEKAKLIVLHYGTYIHECQKAAGLNEEFYQYMTNSIDAYLEKNKEKLEVEV
mgnify:CR=1 FL=1